MTFESGVRFAATLTAGALLVVVAASVRVEDYAVAATAVAAVFWALVAAWGFRA